MIRSKLTFNYSGKTKSVVVNHEEQYTFATLNRTKQLEFLSMEDLEQRFLSEEEYFNYVDLKISGNTIRLKKVKRIKIEKKSNGVEVTLKFVELEGGPD